ncbi:HDIG domain-containing protein [Leptolyngbya sp. BL0902]|uniref:HD family phosphohydrolase n=1 Tax=Leptolyngbya sp. BL0902 TaxID=1115757 RepID=UPI0018E90934|nr:HDIG domain-containing metalloprotein [Leptolyngbya sp. BL0902]QQE66638.1 HDIG domain-containing protein [Leptolyngbya sp. BL0902]
MRALKEFVTAIEHWVSTAPEVTADKLPTLPLASPVKLAQNARGPSAPPMAARPRSSLSRGQALMPCRATKRHRDIRHPRLAILLATIGLTAMLGQRFYNQPSLQAGSVAPDTIYAPADASVEDKQTTEERRRDARNGALRVLKVDTTATETALRSLQNATAQLTTLRREAGPFPFVPTDVLSTQVQTYLRRSNDATWLKLRSFVLPLSESDAASAQVLRLSLDGLVQGQTLTPAQQQAMRELWNYAQRSSVREFKTLLDNVEQARQSYQEAQANLALLSNQVEGLTYSPTVLDLGADHWTGTQVGVRQAAERMLAQGIPPGLSSEVLYRAIQTQLRGTVPRPGEEIASQLLQVSLQPNLIEDPDQTRLKADMAAEAVRPVLVDIRRGDRIVAAGENITHGQFVLLDYFNLSQRRFNAWGLALFGGLVSGGIGLFLVIERWSSQHLRQQDYILLSAMVVSAGILKALGVAAYGLPAIGLLAGNFYGPVLGGTLVGLLAVLLPIGSTVSGVSWVAGVAGAMVCSLLAGRMRSREELALLGGSVGLTQGVVYLLLTMIVNPVSLVSAWSGILAGAAMQGIYGVLSSIVALGLSPYLEHVFDLITPIRLAELSNPNRPLLKRLASEAPGTFQHTLFVASLAEAAARALGCNVELVRAGTLYHDIGKMHDPLGFIENQMGGPNKHDQLNDPWLSATIIKRHVSEGLVMARKCRLPRALQAFIPEHQGTMLISYFHHQAQEMAQADPTITVKEADFRYDGPIPQSPETGIVMLADSCEAALRSLTEATPDEALAMVNRILRTRWKENQLVESGLTREHMTVIADIFVQVWQQYNHKRIAYPKAALSPNLAPKVG